MNWRQHSEDRLNLELETIAQRLVVLDKAQTTNEDELRIIRAESNRLRHRAQEINMSFRLIAE